VPVRQVSRKRQAELDNPARGAVRDRVFARDGSCLLRRWAGIPPCIGNPFTPHHLRKAAQGGPYNELNLVTLCAGHNDWVETSEAADVVHAWGLVKRNSDTYADVWARLAAAGLVTYKWTGQPLRSK
jgi:hypothetical protein